MTFWRSLLRVLLGLEALMLVPGLPAWAGFAEMSTPARAYLLCLGVFSALALGSLVAGKPSARIWAWAAAATNLPVFPVLTPVGVVIAALLLLLDLDLSRWRSLRKPAVLPLEWRSWLAWLAGLAFCWAGASNVHRFAEISGLPSVPSLLLFGGLWLAVPLALAIHQAGHWLGGWMVDLRMVTGWSGWADPQPAASSPACLRQRLLLWSMGGPLASLALGALLLFLLIEGAGSAWEGLAELAGLTAVISLGMFLVSILPWRAFGYRSDGAILLANLRHAAEYRRDRAVALIAGDWLSGSAPGNWDPRDLRAAASWPDGSRQHATACGLNYLYSLDKDFGSSARFWIGRLANEFASNRSSVPARWKLEIVYYFAAFDCSGRLAEVPVWRRSAGRAQGVPDVVRLRSDAALVIAQGRAAKAAALLNAAERLALGDPHGSFWEFELELINRLRERASALPPSGQPAPRSLIPLASFDQISPRSLQ